MKKCNVNSEQATWGLFMTNRHNCFCDKNISILKAFFHHTHYNNNSYYSQ